MVRGEVVAKVWEEIREEVVAEARHEAVKRYERLDGRRPAPRGWSSSGRPEDRATLRRRPLRQRIVPAMMQ